MAITPPFNPAAVFTNTAVAPFAPVGRGNPGTGPGEKIASTSFPPLDQPETTQGSQLQSGRRESAPTARPGGTEVPAEQNEIRELKQRDRAVRAHEQAHQSVGGRYTSAAQLQYTRGPDGRLYAKGGEVGIDTSPVPGDAEATLRKAAIVRRAALAPADPSPQDRRVAAAAAQLQAQAQAQLEQERSGQASPGNPPERFALQANFLQRLVELGVIDDPLQIRPGTVLDTVA